MGTVTWETAADWDAAQSESGVVHESVANTDHDDDTIVKKGYAAGTPYRSTDLVAYYPLHEDSGTTANDLSGNSNDAAYAGPTLGQTGLLGTTCPSFDGSDDWVDLPDSFGIFDGSSDWTLTGWWLHNAEQSFPILISARNKYYILLRCDDSSPMNAQLFTRDGNANNVAITGPSISLDTWYFFAGTYDSANDELEFYVDAVSQGTASISNFKSTINFNGIGGEDGGTGTMSGRVADARIYNAALSASDIQTLYDVVDTDGSLTTSSKTA